MKRILCALAFVLAATPAFAQSAWGPGADDAAFNAMLKSSFRERPAAPLTRLDQDGVQAFCSDPVTSQSRAGAAAAERLEREGMAAVKFPADGQFLGDWRRGEAIAQSGRGLTWTDAANQPSGGNCYNCHQISAAEISFGTIGPSLLGYGKLRGNTPEMQRQTWAKIWNSKASNACSNMPRAGHMGILTEAQVKDIMALLLDPDSPVNK
ncbi:MAG: sulfur oxidation c-type cytochrome SoxX [Tagaea sp.]|nr:sulfur oxidation c-type cytochrome SoxX [Tagaea sp.]